MTPYDVPVSIIVPCHNEEGFIDGFIENVLEQDYIGISEILIAEGQSTDSTRVRLDQWSTRDARILVVDNDAGIVSTGLNRAIEKSSGRIVVRMDVHTKYAPNYVSNCVSVLLESKAANVGGPWRAAGDTFLQKAISAAFQSRFSSGGAMSHDVTYEGPVDSVYLGCWWRDTLVDVGMFDEELVRNQDDELNLRLVRAGCVVWQSPRIRSSYSPRNSLTALFRQYFQYGYWKLRVIQKHSSPAAIRHLIPGLTLLIGFLLALLSVKFTLAAYALALSVSLYFGLSIMFSVSLAINNSDWRLVPLLPLIFAMFHFGYAAGSVKGYIDFFIRRGKVDGKMTAITR